MNILFVKLKWKLQGKKTIKFPNGDLYIGDIDHLSYIPKSWGTLTGRGMYLWANGDLYEGSFVEGKPHGKGTFRYSNGGVYSGFFKNGKYHGRGKMQYSNGDVYEGDWKKDKKNGKGKLTLIDGTVIIGDFVNNLNPQEILAKQKLELNKSTENDSNTFIQPKNKHGFSDIEFSKN